MKGKWYRKPMPEGVTQKQILSPVFKACEIKLPFDSKDEAENAITEAGLSPSGYRRGTSYKCRYCEYWHVTSKRPRPKTTLGRRE